MNDKSSSKFSNDADELLPEYEFDYQQAKPNRFARESANPMNVVVLDDDVARVFTTPSAVNKALRALIEVVPRLEAVGDSQRPTRVKKQSNPSQQGYSTERIGEYLRTDEPWDANEDEQLRASYASQGSIDQIAARLQRHPRNICARLEKLNLL